MKKVASLSGVEAFVFSNDNKLRVFPPNTYKFKPKNNIVLDELQECILDNFWFQYNNKREERGYLLSILNSLAEYFDHINKKMAISDAAESIEQRPIYVIYDGIRPGIYISFEEIITQKIETKAETGHGMSWKKYTDIDEALNRARNILGINYYIEPAAREYIQKLKMPKPKPVIQKNIPVINISGEGTSRSSYKKNSQKEVDPLDGEYIDWKIIEKFESISPEWKKEMKEQIIKELKEELKNQIKTELKSDFQAKIDALRKEICDKYEFPIIDGTMEENIGEDENMDLRGYCQGEE